MGRASVTIAITGEYNSKAVDRAERSMRSLAVATAAANNAMGAGFVNAGGKIAEFGGKVYGVGERMERMGDSLTRNVTMPIVTGAGLAIKAATDLDTSYHNLTKTVDGTEEEMQALKDAAVEMSKVQPVDANTLLDIMGLGGQLGIAKENLEQFAQVVSGLDIATDMEAEQAAMNLAQFANITKMSQGDMSNYASTIVALGNNFATTESQVSDMAMRVAAAGSQVGMSQADILGLSTALTSMGVSAEAGGTAISTIMSQIDKDIALNSDNVKTWAEAAGMSAQDFANAWKSDPVQALSALLSGMESATTEGSNMSVMLEELGISSLRQTDVMKRLAGNSELVGEAVSMANQAWGENTALSQEVDKRNESLASKFQVLANRATAVAAEVGGPVADALLAALDAAQPLFTAIEEGAKAFAAMDKAQQQQILGWVGMAAAAGPVLKISGKLTKGIGSLIVKIGKGVQQFGVFKSALQATDEGMIKNFRESGTLASKLGLLFNRNKQAASATQELATATSKVGTSSSSATLSLGGFVGKVALIAGATAAVWNLYKMEAGFAANAEAAKNAISGLDDFSEVVANTQARSMDLSLAMSDSGQSISSLQDTTQTAFATIVETIQTDLANAGVITEEGAERIRQALADALTAANQTAEAYANQIEILAKHAGENLSAEQYAQYTADVTAAFEGGKDAAQNALNAQLQAIEAYHQQAGTIGSDAYNADIKAAEDAYAAQLATLETAKNNALSQSSDMFQGLSQEAQDGWAKVAEWTKSHTTDSELLMNELSSTYREGTANAFNNLIKEVDTGTTGAWMAAQAATVAAGGELDTATKNNINNILDSFDNLPAHMQDDATAAMQALANSIEAGGVELGDVGNMTAEELVDAIRSKMGDLETVGSDGAQNLADGMAAGQSSVQASAQTLHEAQKHADASQDMRGYGMFAYQNLTTGLNAGQTSVRGAASKLSTAQNAARNGNGYAYGNQMGVNLATGLTRSQGAVRSNANALGNAQNAANKSGSSYTWGSHLGQNLASGLGSQVSNVAGAALRLAQAISSRLGQTVAEIGPLHYTDVWGVHLAQNIERGLYKGIPGIMSASRAVANSIDSTLGNMNSEYSLAGTSTSNMGRVVNNYYVSIDSINDEEAMRLINFQELSDLARRGSQNRG